MFSFFRKKTPDVKDEGQVAPKSGFRFPPMMDEPEEELSLADIIAPYPAMPGVRSTSVMAMDGEEMVVQPPDMNHYADWLIDYRADGLGFFGYPRLSEMAQRPEYRKMVETLAKEATREWIEFTYKDHDHDDKIKQIEAEFKRLQIREHFYCASENDGFFGLAHILLDFGEPIGSSHMMQPIRISADSIPVGGLKRLINIEPIWTSPNDYSAYDPFDDHFYKPKNWFINGRLVDSTRLLTFVARKVPDLLKPAYNFGGMALTQLAKPYVDNWLRTRQSVSDLINSFSIVNLQTNMTQLMQEPGDYPDNTGSVAGLLNRVQGFNQLRHNQGTFITDKESEELKNLAVPLTGLDKLQAQAQEQIASIASQPLVKMFGIQPTGLNASSDGEIRVWYDEVSSYQEYFFRPQLERLFKIVQLSLWGKIDPNLGFDFVPLWQLDAKTQSDMHLNQAQADALYLDKSVISPDEARQRFEKMNDLNH